MGRELAVYRGPVPAGDLALGDGDTRIFGETRYGGLGHSVALGDVDGDGYAEIVTIDFGTKAALVFSGSATGELRPDAAVAAVTSGSGDYVDTVARLDREDGARLAVAMTGTVGDARGGVVRVLSGPFEGAVDVDDAEFEVVADSTWPSFGWALDAGGDVNGDGWTDLAIGAPQCSRGDHFAGCAVAFTSFEPGSYDINDAAVLVWGEANGAYVGFSVAIGPDVTGDATDDLTMGWGMWVVAGHGR